jgi:hypothetical protein
MLIVLAVGFAIIEQNYFVIFIGLLSLFLTFLPYVFERRYKIDLPAEFEIIITLFLYLSLFVGIGQDFYYKIWWWDILFHGFSGVALGFAGFLILYVFYKNGKLKISFKLIAFFTFCFALALGGIWEIFEYGVDSSFSFSDMQRSRNLCQEGFVCDSHVGVVDTMNDLILDAIGALIASLSGYFYLRRGGAFLFDRMIVSFEDKNPWLFSRRTYKH